MKKGRRPIQNVLAFLNCYVWRWAWFRVSWSVPSTFAEVSRWGEDHAIPGTFKLHFPVRPSWLFEKRF